MRASRVLTILVVLFIAANICGMMMLKTGSLSPEQMARIQSQQAYRDGSATLGRGAATYSSRASDTAQYEDYGDNPVHQVAREPVSTFGLDMNTASYANVRRFLNAGRLPNPNAVRVEELLNYFPPISGDIAPSRVEDSPFAVAYEFAPCPWNDNNTLLWLALTTEASMYESAPPVNLVFLIDVSGSMNSPERLPLVKASLRMLAERLRAEDRISMVTYAGTTAVALPPTPGSAKAEILSAVEQLGAGGSTAGGAGLALAYKQAQEGLIPDGVNRILLCTDGDFNVGISSTEELTNLVTRERESGVTLSVLGFGGDNLNDAMMSRITTYGNGNYSYIDTLSEAKKVLDDELAATFVTVAKDAKAQIEFNSANVIEYRQIGYEKRQLRQEDFNDDRVDAGDIGAGKRVTVLYELTLTGKQPSIDPLRYATAQPVTPSSPDAAGGEGAVLSPDAGPAQEEPFAPTDMKLEEMAYLKFRWKKPDDVTSEKAEMPLLKSALRPTFNAAGSGLRFAAAVAAYGQKLRANPNLVNTSWDEIAGWAEGARGSDIYRAEFVQLLRLAEVLDVKRGISQEP